MIQTSEITLQEMVACVDREIAFRAKLFPRWVSATPPKMTQKTADQEQARMRAVRAQLVRSAAVEAALRALASECNIEPVDLEAMVVAAQNATSPQVPA